MERTILKQYTNNADSNKYLRKCSGCGKIAYTYDDLEYFVLDKGSRLGRRNYCKECKNKDNIVYRPEPKRIYIKKMSDKELEKYRKIIRDNMVLEDSMIIKFTVAHANQIEKQNKGNKNEKL